MQNSFVFGETISLSDVVSNQVFNVRLIDRCGDRIPSEREPIDRCRKHLGGDESYPPQASEACAYDNLGDKVIVSLDEVQISDENVETYLNVYERQDNKENGILVYEKKLDKLQFNIYTFKRRTEEWPLVTKSGKSLNVGREGKKYNIEITRKKYDDVLYTSGTQDILVDDCRLRNDKILRLINDSSIHHNPGFDLYLKLLNRVATKMCSKLEVGLLGSVGADTFSQRCRYQCINNYFTNKMIDSTALPLSANDYLNKTHLKVSLQKADAIHYVDNFRLGDTWISARFSLLAYITMEDNYRAGGYAECDGPLNLADEEASINIIEEAVDEIVVEAPSLQLTGLAEKIFAQIRMHFERTETLYNKIIGE